MSEFEFDTLVNLMKTIACVESGNAINQRRAGDIEDDIDYARSILVKEDE